MRSANVRNDLNIVNLYRSMSKLKLKINLNISQLLRIVVSVALKGEFERFCVFFVDCYAKPTNILNIQS